MPSPSLAPSLVPPADVDPVAALVACHARIRQFTDGLARLAALPDLGDPRVPASAAQAYRYFAEGLPLHQADEDLSLAPRLRRAAPACGPLLDELGREHAAVDACLATLLPLLQALSEGRRVPQATLRAAVGFLRDILLPHIAREEAELFPLCDALPAAERVAVVRELHARRR